MPKPSLREVEQLFHQAVALDPRQQPAFLEIACAGDAQLRAAVEDLLKQDQHIGSEEFLESPVARRVERLRPLLPTVPDVVRNRPGPSHNLPTIAGYELLEEIGRGGMGVVYKARQLSLNRVVALKMLLAGEPFATEQLVRFRTEAEALAKLNHPNIITVFDIADSEGRPYFTMEYIAGPSLADFLDGHPQDAAAAARLLEVVARAVHAVHQCGIIHRDLKPGNILLSLNGCSERGAAAALHAGSRLNDAIPKITDFGLAKDQSDDRKLTRTGVAMGTPSYMAPEQARFRGTISPVTDVYALGSILYEMLTGRPPFDAEGPAETINQLLNEEPLSPLFIRPALPRDAVTICLKCLEKSPRKRYATALELAEDLHRFQAGEPIHARPVGLAEQAYRWCRRRPTVAGLVGLSSVLALICVVAGIGYLIQRNAAVGYLSQLNAELEKQVEDEKQQIDNENHEIARLHVRIGLGAMEEGNTFTAVLHFMHALDMDEGTDRDQNHLTRIGTALRQCPRLLDVTWFEQEVLCADHQQAAMIGANHVIDVRRLRETQSAGSGLKHTEPPYEGALSPDGRFLGVLAGKGKATIWNLATKEAHDLSSENREGVRRLVFHPNGRIVFAQRMEAIVEAWELAAWKPIAWEGMTKTTVLSALSDDGRWLLTCDAEHSGQVWDAGTGEPIGAVLRFENPVRSARIAPGGAILAVLGSNNELSIWNVRANRRLGNSIRLPCAVSRIVFSPDGARVATIGNDRVLRVWQIQTGVMAAQTLPLEHGTTIENFSADGRCLLTLSESGGARVWDSATGRAATPPLRHGGRLVFAAFQADGTELVTVSRSGLKCVWELPRGPEVRRSAPSELTSGTGSSVNRRLIELANGITVRTNGGTDGLLAPARRGEQVLEHALLSPDGRRVAFCDDTTTVFIRDSAGVESSTPQLRHRSPVRHAAFSPDGKRMLTACEDGTVLLWDVGSGELLAHPMRHTLPIQRVMFRDEDTRAHIFHEGDSVSMWDLRADPRPREELRTLAQILSGTEIDGSQREQALDPRSLRERWNRLSSAR